MPEGWDGNPNRLQQKDLDARWVQKNGVNHYGCKNNICINVEHGFIRRYAVTPANIHDSQMLQMLFDPENIDDYVWADSGYEGKCFEDLLNFGGFESCIHEKAAAIRLAKQLKRVTEKINNQSLSGAHFWLHSHDHGWQDDQKDWA